MPDRPDTAPDKADIGLIDHMPSAECNLVVEADFQSPQQRDAQLSPIDEIASINELVAGNVCHRVDSFPVL
jgi:hypothetical protein